MQRNEFMENCNQLLRDVRTEYQYSQEKMAQILGISKKTLVEVEKGRSSLTWACCVALCTIFHNSTIINEAFGGNQAELILELAFEGNMPNYPQTMGGKVWWQDIQTDLGFKIQQNIISRHYRIINSKDRRICSSFDLAEIQEIFQSLIKEDETWQ